MNDAGPSTNSKARVAPPPQNLRFQRRQSERAFYEGAYRDNTPTMEYPSGPSPWASSPEGHRTSFSGDVPRDNVPSGAQYAGASDGGASGSATQANGSGHQQGQSYGGGQEGGWTPEQHQNQWHQDDPQQQRGQGEDGRRPQSARYHNVPPQQRQHMPQYRLQAKITGLERTAKKDPILRFDVHVSGHGDSECNVLMLNFLFSQTNLPKFRTTQFRDVRRTHSEFQKLASHLTASNPEALVPAVPPASTSAGMGTDEDEARTKTSLQRWLNVVCSNDVLMRDEEMVFFVESDFGYSPVVRKRQPATGVRRKVLKQFAPPPDDTPELFESRPIVKAFYLGSMDSQQKLDRVVRNRRCTCDRFSR